MGHLEYDIMYYWHVDQLYNPVILNQLDPPQKNPNILPIKIPRWWRALSSLGVVLAVCFFWCHVQGQNLRPDRVMKQLSDDFVVNMKKIKRLIPYHPWDWYIYLHEWLIFMVFM